MSKNDEAIGGKLPVIRPACLRARPNRPDMVKFIKRYQQLPVSDASKARVFDRPRNVYFPRTVSDTSEAACDTEFDVRAYKMLANLDPRERLFLVYNPATHLPDYKFTTCVIQRYRMKSKKNKWDSSVPASGYRPSSCPEGVRAPAELPTNARGLLSPAALAVVYYM